MALVIGAEGSGLTNIVRKRCQVILSLPMRGHVDSLNAATAGAIVLYDLLRREMLAGAESSDSGFGLLGDFDDSELTPSDEGDYAG